MNADSLQELAEIQESALRITAKACASGEIGLYYRERVTDNPHPIFFHYPSVLPLINRMRVMQGLPDLVPVDGALPCHSAITDPRPTEEQHRITGCPFCGPYDYIRTHIKSIGMNYEDLVFYAIAILIGFVIIGSIFLGWIGFARIL